MKKLASIIAGLIIGYSSIHIVNSKQKNQPIKPNFGLYVVYDPYYFEFETRHGKYERVELSEDGKRYFCRESLIPPLSRFFYRGQIKFIDSDQSYCDGKTDQINFDHREKKSHNPFYQKEFRIADSIFDEFRRLYKVKTLRQEWIKRKDRCKKKCSFEFDLRPKKRK